MRPFLSALLSRAATVTTVARSQAEPFHEVMRHIDYPSAIAHGATPVAPTSQRTSHVHEEQIHTPEMCSQNNPDKSRA